MSLVYEEELDGYSGDDKGVLKVFKILDKTYLTTENFYGRLTVCLDDEKPTEDESSKIIKKLIKGKILYRDESYIFYNGSNFYDNDEEISVEELLNSLYDINEDDYCFVDSLPEELEELLKLPPK